MPLEGLGSPLRASGTGATREGKSLPGDFREGEALSGRRFRARRGAFREGRGEALSGGRGSRRAACPRSVFVFTRASGGRHTECACYIADGTGSVPATLMRGLHFGRARLPPSRTPCPMIAARVCSLFQFRARPFLSCATKWGTLEVLFCFFSYLLFSFLESR